MYLQTYTSSPHAVSGAMQTVRTGKKAAQGYTEARGKDSKDIYSLKHCNPINSITNEIQYFTRNQIRKFKRNSKNK